MLEKQFTPSAPHAQMPAAINGWKSRVLATLGLLMTISVLCLSAVAQTITFETPTYTIGNINGQDGWTKTGPYDHTVSSSLGTAGFGAQSLRISNAITSGSFGDMSFSKSLVNEAGETTAANNGLSGGIRQKNFEMEFNIASTVPGSQQPGLAFSIAPDRGDGARMSYLRFEDQADGIHVIFDDYRDNAPFGTAIGDAANGCGVGDFFTDIDIATLNRTTTHTIKFAIFFIDGPRNDVVQIYIDGVLKQTGTTWEDYSRYCQASPPATVDSLLFRTAGAAAPGTAGNGLLFDNMNSSSSTNVSTNLVVDDDGLGSAADCNDTSPAYTSINSAVIAANPGDTVRVCSGTYPLASTVALNKAGVTILGVGATKPVVQASSALGNAFFVTGSGVTIDNLEIQKTDLADQQLIAVQANNFTAQNNLVYGPNPGAIWNIAGFVSRAFVISNQTGTLITNNVIHTLRQPAYMSGSNNVAAGTISNNQVSGTKGWVVEGGNYTFTGNTWGEPQNQSCDIALLNDPSLNPAFYQPLLALSTANDNAFICAQYPAGENGRATAYVNDGAGPGGNGSNNTNYTLINDAIAGTLIGGTVQVAAGTYNEDVAVSKTVKVLGAGPTGTTVVGPIGGASSSTFAIQASNVELAGFTITRAGNNTTDWNNANLNSAGVSVQGQAITGLLMHDNLVTGMRSAIDINNSNGHTIRNNVIDFNHTGLIFRNQTDNITFTENQVTNNRTVGILFLDASGGTNSPVQTAVNCTFFNNNVSGNWYGEIVDRQSGGSLPAPGTNLKNFSGNWYGNTAPVVTTLNSAEPPYTGHIPVAYGGSAVDPGGQPDIAGPASANFDYTPLLAGSGDTNVQTTPGRGTYGFQGNFSALNVSATSAQVGATSKIQEAIDLITAGGTLSIPTGTYPGNVNVNKALSINGTFTVGGTFTTSAAGVVVSPGYSPGIINTGDLSFGSGTTVNMELNGVIAGTNYDQFNVTGTVNISPSVTLNATVGYAPGAGDSYTIINNDGGDAVTGNFAGLPDGTVFFIGANSFRIDYDGGSGNDVVITSVSLCNAASIPTNITSPTGQVVSVPVNVDNTTGNGLYSADFTVTYNSSVLSPNGVLATNFGVTLGTVGTSNGGGRILTVNNPSPGTLVISIFGSNPFSGSGDLVNMSFNAIGLPGTTSPMNFSAFKFNEGTPCLTTSNGLVTITSGSITGTITYGNAIGAPATRGIPNATLNAVGSVNTSANTDPAGFYTLSGMGSGPYTVTPSKTGGVNGALSGLDSARIAQHVVGLIVLNPTQLTVADVSGAGGVSSFDSALIARYTVALPNSGSSGTWIFDPTNRSYPNVDTDQTGQNYVALLMGDVTGNWNDPNSIIGARAGTTRGPKGISITAGNVNGSPGSEIVVPVTIGDVSGKGVVAYQFEMNYDPTVLSPAENPVQIGGTMSDTMSVTANADTPGVLRVVVFGALPMNGEGTLLNLKFTAIGEIGTATDLSWQQFMLNEGGGLQTRNTDGRVEVTAAAPQEASIVGKLLTAMGQGVPNTRITLTDTTGASRTILSNGFGQYQFGNVRIGETYTISVESRMHTFTPVTVSVSGSIANVDIIAEQ